jgi:hypothetical protein
MATESSVVVALKEVRRLELDRQRREEESRRALDDERSRAEGNASVQYGPGMQPFGQGTGNTGWGMDPVAPGFARPVHRTAEVMALGPGSGGPGQDFAHPQSYVGQGVPMGWDVNVQGFAPQTKSKSSGLVGVLLTLVVCGGAAGAGYWKLNRDHATQMSQMQARIQRTEDLRNEAVAGRSKAEQELKVRMAELETKLTTASAKATAASAALALAAKNALTAPAGPTTLPPAAAGAGYRKGRGLTGRSAAAAAPLPKASPLPKPAAPLPPPPAPAAKVAKKKNLSDDPLGGLRL